MPWIIAAIVVVVVLTVVGGVVLVMNLTNSNKDNNGPRADTSASASSTPTGSTRPSPSSGSKTSATAGSGPYKAIADLCAKTDVSPLGDWSAKNEGQSKEQATVPSLYERSNCSYELRSAAGVKVTLDLKAEVYFKTADAQDSYDSGHDFDKSRYFDADLTGLGDQAYGTNRDWDIGLKTSDYTIKLRAGNLVLSSTLVTFGTSFTPKDQIKQKALAEIKSVLSAIPKG